MTKFYLTLLLFVVSTTQLISQNNSQFISQTIPTTVDSNEVFNVSVTFKNTGTTTWTSTNLYRLGPAGPQDDTTWGAGTRIALPNDVSPGNQVTFQIQATAPSSGDGYGTNMQWQMVQDGVAWFGETSDAVPILVGGVTLDDSLLTPGTSFSVSDHIVATSMFHWYGATTGQLSSPWIPLEGRENWTGDVPYWKTVIKQSMAANIDVFYILVIPTMEQARINLFRALNEMRREGWEVPKVCPFFDPIITYTVAGTNGDASTAAGKDEIVSHYIRFYQQYYSVNFDAYADNYIYTQDSIPVLNTWHTHLHIDNYSSLTRADVSSRLSAEFGAAHPIFNNGIKMITTAISPSFVFADEKVHMFEVHEYYKENTANGIVSAQIKPGYWDQNVRNPGYLLPRNGGSHYATAWSQLGSTVSRVYIESFNEYDEGSGIYAAKTDTIYKKTDGGMNNTGNDVWSSTNDPYEYIKATATGAASFNNIAALDAEIVWHNIPATMTPGDTIVANVVVKNTGNTQWNAATNFKFGQQELLDPILFGHNRYLIDDTQDDIPDFGGIFRGRTKTFELTVIAPDSIATYDTHWGMLQEGNAWFGETLTLPIEVRTDDAKFISQQAPESVDVGEVFSASVTFENNGITTWTQTDYFLGTQNPQDNTAWGVGNRIALPNDVAPGEQVTFTMNLTAPLNGNGLQWQMVKDDVTAKWFGDLSTIHQTTALYNDSQFISQVVPTSIAAGSTFPVTFVFENNSTRTWKNSNPNGIFLESQNPQSNTTWGTDRISLLDSVAPGEQITITANVTAPTSSGTYNFQWRLVQDGVESFGETSTNVAIVVAPAANNSTFISQNIPTTIVKGEDFSASFVFENTGNTIWKSTTNYALGSQSPQDNLNWGLNRVALPNDVLPGEQVTITTDLITENTGAQNLSMKMVQDGVEWFGAQSTITNINVNQRSNDAEFISQTAPSVVTEGEAFNVTMVYKNTGNTTWTTANWYRLGTQNPQDNTIWGVGTRVALPHDVAPGGQVTFSANLTAPTSGNALQWKMVQDGVEWFGELSDQHSITINSGPGAKGFGKEQQENNTETTAFDIYPNPVKLTSTLHINGTFESDTKIVLINAYGIKVYEKEITSDRDTITINISEALSKEGVYIIQLIDNNTIKTKKIVVTE